MKVVSLILNVIISPAIMIAGIYYFYVSDIRQAVLLALIVTSAFNILALFVKMLKLIFSTLTFNIFGAIKQTFQIILSILILCLYWLIYYFIWGNNFVLNI